MNIVGVIIIAATTLIGVALMAAYISVLIDMRDHYKMVAERYEELYMAAMMDREPQSYLKK